MSNLYPDLFNPLTIRHKTLKHRLNFGAHTNNMAENGLPSARQVAYYHERARGGAAMIVVEPMPVHPTAVLTRGNFLPADDAVIPYFQKITDACQGFGTVMIQQLYHVGQHGDSDNSFHPYWSPSALPSYHDSDGSHWMNEAEIEQVIAGFAAAARRAQAAGFDGVELFAAYHGLIDQFWTPWSNRREDCWGGSLENRTRFSTRIIESIRALTGEDFIIGLAVNYEPDFKVSLTMESLQEILIWHDERQLIDYVTCGSGSYFDFYKLMPTFIYPDKLGASYAEQLKEVLQYAKVQAESHIRTPENANSVISSRQADMVSIVRGQIADPHLANKAAADRPEDVRGCISCNQMCWGRRSRDYWISCLINPSVGWEYEWNGDRFIPSEQKQSVLVIGGGPAGLEVARVCAERGHQVRLAEAAPGLGGRFHLAGKQPRREQILELIDWYERQLRRLGVEIGLNQPLDVTEIRQIPHDILILATGALPDELGFQRQLPEHDQLPGSDKGNLWPVESVLERSCQPGEKVLLLDDIGHWQGCGTAWHLAEKGHKVSIVTPYPTVGFDLARSAADYPIRQRLRKLGVNFITESVVSEWHGTSASITSLLDATVTKAEFDSLILATCAVSNTYLQEDLVDQGMPFHQIGDCVAPRHANSAFFEGRKLGLRL